MCNKRKPNFLKQFVVGVAGLVTLGLTAQAQIFTGSISFVGGATLNAPLGSATGFSNFSGPDGSVNPTVLEGSQTGDYASVPGGTPATFSAPFTFNPAPVSPFQLWTFTVGATTYSFDITSITTDYQTPNFLNLMGTGVAHATGYVDSTGTWTITDTSASGGAVQVTFGSGVNAVPEPGAFSFLLIGGLLLGGRMFVKRRQEILRVAA